MLNLIKQKYKEYKFKKLIAEYNYTFDLQEDEFNGNQILKFSCIGVMLDDKIWTYSYNSKTFFNLFKFGFANYYGKDYITFECKKNFFPLKKGDSINFLFTNDKILSFTLNSNGEVIGKDNGQTIIENRLPITTPELSSFINDDFRKWKLLSKYGYEVLGGDAFLIDFDNIEKLQYEIKRMAKEYRDTVSSTIRNYIPVANRINPDRLDSNNKRDKIPQHTLDNVWNRDLGECVLCRSSENLEFDHIIPVSKGGANIYRNLQLLCEECNRKKSNSIG